MRILWSSNTPLTNSGYGTQTAAFVPRLKALGHDVAVFAFYGCDGSVLEWDGVTIYPKHLDPFGNDIVGGHARHFRADCVLTLIDAWVMAPEKWGGVPWVAWAPVDTDPISAAVTQQLHKCFQPIAYSRFGEQQMRAVGLDPLYVPHGIDTAVYRPRPTREAKQALGWPEDRFVVGIVAANKGYPGRKAWEQQLRAFADFKRQHADSVLYLHTFLGQSHGYDGADIPAMLDFYGLRAGHDVAWCDQYRYVAGMYSTEDMVTLYSGLDVLMNVAYGEGFGLPILEAQACGTPVIIGDWSSMSELLFGGWCVPREASTGLWWPLVSEWRIPHPRAICEALVAAYGADREAIGAKARQGALAYDADRVTREHWAPALARIEERLFDVPRATCVAGALRAAA